jgi:uncharacterized protein (DUF302 family)
MLDLYWLASRTQVSSGPNPSSPPRLLWGERLTRRRQEANMFEASYGYTRVLEGVTYEQALERVPLALKAEGFGVLTEIDVAATMKQKLGVDFRRYKILGACNPPLAHQALSADPLIGLLLPCNVVVFEEQGQAVVSFTNPRALFKLVDDPRVASIADEVDARLQRALRLL